MDAKEFLTSKKVFHGLMVSEDNTTGNSHEIADLMEEYHQAQLKLLGIANVVGQSEQLVCEGGNKLTAKEIYFGQCLLCDKNIEED